MTKVPSKQAAPPISISLLIFFRYLPNWGLNILLAFHFADTIIALACVWQGTCFWQAVSLLVANFLCPLQRWWKRPSSVFPGPPDLKCFVRFMREAPQLPYPVTPNRTGSPVKVISAGWCKCCECTSAADWSESCSWSKALCCSVNWMQSTLFLKNCFPYKGWQDWGWGCFSLGVCTSTIAQSPTSKFIITATVELKFKGAWSDSFHLTIYTVSKEKYFLYLIQTPVRHQSVWMWTDVQMANVWRKRINWEKIRIYFSLRG